MRRFRVELFERGRGGDVGSAPVSSHVDSIVSELYALRHQAKPAEVTPQAAPHSLESAIAVWSGVEEIQRRLEVTRSEISALQDK